MIPTTAYRHGSSYSCAGPSDRDVPSADDPIVIVYSADDNPQLGDELRLPLAALKEFIESSADLLAPNLKKAGKK